MEYPPLVAGETARFAVHLTNLADFRAFTAGRPRVEFVPERGGTPVTLAGNEPSRPGVFRVEGTIPAAGQYRWAVVFDAPGLSDRHTLGAATVFADQASANAEAEKAAPDDPSAFSYLKEQQWTNAFAAEPVRERELRSSLRAPATIEALSGGDAVVSAPAAGRFTAESLIRIGAAVTAGQILGRLEPRMTDPTDRATMAADVDEAAAALDAARAEHTRTERLLADRAVPARRVEDAKRAVAVAEARLRALDARLAQRDQVLGSGGGAAAGNAFVLRAPIAGRVVAVMATLGAAYEEGAPLFRVVRTDRVELRALVPSADAPTVREISSLSFEAPGRPDAVVLTPQHQHDAGVLDEITRALPIQFEIDNPGGLLIVGESGTAILYRQARVRALTVPKAAVLFEAGRPYTFVQVSGRELRASIHRGRHLGR